MSTPYLWGREDDQSNSSTTAQPPTPVTPVLVPDLDVHVHRPSPEVRQGYRPAAPIKRFNNKSLNWPAWFRHFRAVDDVHGWNKEQRALQLVSYLDETAMNVAQELGDNELYNYAVLLKLLSDRFDPASRVSAFHSRFHGRSRRHHEDADTFADVLAELCRVGYPQSPPELRQELIAEQFVRGQSDPELKKYLWVVIRTQKDKKLQTLIEVCTDFSSLMTPSHLHRPAEQTFSVHQEVETYAEGDGDSEDVFATVPPGPIGDLRNHPPHQPYNRGSRWPAAWDTRCARSPDKWTPPDHLKEIDNSQIRIVDSALRHGPVGTIPESSASAVDSLDTCRPAAHDRTSPYRSNLWVGNSNLIIVNNGMAITNRETPHRPGPHPHRSTRTSFEPHVIVIHRIELIILTAGHSDQLYSSTTEFMYRNMHVNRRSGSSEVTGGAFT